jgi:hypothetical protein
MDLKDKSYKILLFSDKYIRMVTNTLEMAIKSGNPSAGIASNSYISNQDLINKTKYCDYSIVVPLLFLFYHWIELVLKGFLITKENKDLLKDINRYKKHIVKLGWDLKDK